MWYYMWYTRGRASNRKASAVTLSNILLFVTETWAATGFDKGSKACLTGVLV